MRVAISAAVLLLLTVSCGGTAAQDAVTPTQPVNPTQLVTPTQLTTSTQPAAPDLSQLDQYYENTVDGFEIQPPRGWIVDEGGLLGTLVFFYGPQPDLYQDVPFHANINVLAEPMQGLELEAYVAQSLEQMPWVLTDYERIGSTRTSLNGQEAYFLEYTFKQGVFPLRGRQLVYANRGKAYIITSTALEAKWHAYDSALDASLRSFRH